MLEKKIINQFGKVTLWEESQSLKTGMVLGGASA
jgi:hypothetical protein